MVTHLASRAMNQTQICLTVRLWSPHNSLILCEGLSQRFRIPSCGGKEVCRGRDTLPRFHLVFTGPFDLNGSIVGMGTGC